MGGNSSKVTAQDKYVNSLTPFAWLRAHPQTGRGRLSSSRVPAAESFS